MDVRFAPLEGITDTIYRRVHFRCFGGVDKYYIPFISPTVHHCFTPREWRAIDPAANAGMPVVPQVLAKDAEHFLWFAAELKTMGYDEINLNIGCPSGTVTAKVKGSGLLREKQILRPFLAEIFARSPLPISIKTRVGYASEAEWPEILDILRAYPMKELIIHPRIRSQFYKGELHLDCFRRAAEAGLPLVYNGDLFDVPACQAAQQQYPGMPVMLGRGLIANPALGRQLKGGAGLAHEEVRAFHDALEAAYAEVYPQAQVHSRMREVMKHMACCFADADKARKAIAKSNPGNYHAALEKLLACPLREEPGYMAVMYAGKA